jgi:hypothetical protein
MITILLEIGLKHKPQLTLLHLTCNTYYNNMKWLFLVHQIHTPNSRERVMVWRAIKKTGAVLYRNSVYVLPYGKERLEDFQWVSQQINDSKGEASVFVSHAESQKEDTALETLFRKARTEDYASLIRTGGRLRTRIHSGKKRKRWLDSQRSLFHKEINQLREELEEIRKIDFFANPLSNKAQQILNDISARLISPEEEMTTAPLKNYSKKDFQGKTWATRENIHIDRVCSAWLIRRFIDPSAKFVFGPENSLPPDAIPFDVYGAEFGHHGENCTFETMVKAFAIRDAAITEMSEIIHDVDLKDHKFGRTEASGLNLVIRSLSDSIRDDYRVLDLGTSILDGLYQSFFEQKKRKS